MHLFEIIRPQSETDGDGLHPGWLGGRTSMSQYAVLQVAMI
jgi:hypothetical protein